MSITLPVNERRTCLSAVEKFGSDYSVSAKYEKASCDKNCSSIAKSNAIEIIQRHYIELLTW